MRERVIFLKNIQPSDAVELSRQFPGIIVFTTDETENNNYIYKNGLLYTSAGGVDNTMNHFNVGGDDIVLVKTRDRVISLETNSVILTKSAGCEQTYKNIYKLNIGNPLSYMQLKMRTNSNAYTARIIRGNNIIITKDNGLFTIRFASQTPSVGSSLVEFSYNNTKHYIIVNSTFGGFDNTTIDLSIVSKQMYANQTYQIHALIMPVQPKNNKIIWQSSNSTIATVDGDGIVKTNNVLGRVIITAMLASDTSIFKTCTINVIDDATQLNVNENIDNIEYLI